MPGSSRSPAVSATIPQGVDIMPKPNIAHGRRSPTFLGPALFCLVTAAAAAAGPGGTAAPTTHVLFMGADITVEKDKEFHRVVDVTQSDLIIKPGSQPVKLPLTQPVDLRINETLKLAEASVAIDHWQAERAYSINADPFLGLARSTALAAGESAVSDLANGARLMASMGVAGANAQLGMVRGTPAEGTARVAVDDALRNLAEQEANVTQSYNTPQQEVFDVGSQSVKASAGEPMYDAIRLTFEVSAKSTLTQPYYAVIAQIRDYGSKPGQARKWAFVRSLGPMNAGEVKNVTVYRGGFPPGYILEGCEVHVYNRGEELSTNLSRKRVPLTADEAQEYQTIEYLGANKGRTLPAIADPTRLPADWRDQLAPDQLNATCYVRVDRSGGPVGVYSDVAGVKPLQDPVLESALKRLRFKPALKDGKPVESIIAVTPGQLGPS